MINKALPTYADVVDAAKRVDGVAHRTPVLTSRTASEISGGQIFLSARISRALGRLSFGVPINNAISRLQQHVAGVLAYSSGNHAQACPLSQTQENSGNDRRASRCSHCKVRSDRGVRG